MEQIDTGEGVIARNPDVIGMTKQSLCWLMRQEIATPSLRSVSQ